MTIFVFVEDRILHIELDCLLLIELNLFIRIVYIVKITNHRKIVEISDNRTDNINFSINQQQRYNFFLFRITS